MQASVEKVEQVNKSLVIMQFPQAKILDLADVLMSNKLSCSISYLMLNKKQSIQIQEASKLGID